MRSLAAKLLLRLCACLPLSVSHLLGLLLGIVINSYPNSMRETTRTNIRLCFPAYPEDRRRLLVRRSLQETGKTLLESGAMWLWSAPRLLRKVRQVSGIELLEAGIVAGKGVILAMPHLGAWELTNLYCSSRWPITTLYRPLRLHGIDTLVRDARERAGARLVPTDARGVRLLYKALAHDELVAILPDQDPEREAGVFAPFFAMPTHTMTLLPRLAGKSGACVVFAYAERLPFGRGYHLHFLPAPAGIYERDLSVAAHGLNQGVESCVLQLPEQYQWSYRRFKTQPDPHTDLYRQ